MLRTYDHVLTVTSWGDSEVAVERSNFRAQEKSHMLQGVGE